MTEKKTTKPEKPAEAKAEVRLGGHFGGGFGKHATPVSLISKPSRNAARNNAIATSDADEQLFWMTQSG